MDQSNIIRIKIVGYDEETDSILVKACSDKSEKSIDEYEPLAYQPISFEELHPAKILEWVAKASIYTVYEQNKYEKWAKAEDTRAMLKTFIGKEFEYDIEYLDNLNKDTVVKDMKPLESVRTKVSEETLIEIEIE